MDSQLSRDIALCLRGSAYLRGALARPNDMERTHPTFASVREIKFQQMPKGAYQWQNIAESIGAWLDVLKWAGTTRIVFRAIQGSASGDSSPAIIGGSDSASTDWWQANSRLVAKPGGQEARVWSVTYRGIGRNAQIPVQLAPNILPLDEACARLASALEDNTLSAVREQVRYAQLQLDSPTPESAFDEELAALDAPLAARQVIAAAQHVADVRPEVGEFALGRLFSAIIEAFEAAVEVATRM